MTHSITNTFNLPKLMLRSESTISISHPLILVGQCYTHRLCQDALSCLTMRHSAMIISCVCFPRPISIHGGSKCRCMHCTHCWQLQMALGCYAYATCFILPFILARCCFLNSSVIMKPLEVRWTLNSCFELCTASKPKCTTLSYHSGPRLPCDME